MNKRWLALLLLMCVALAPHTVRAAPLNATPVPVSAPPPVSTPVPSGSGNTAAPSPSQVASGTPTPTPPPPPSSPPGGASSSILMKLATQLLQGTFQDIANSLTGIFNAVNQWVIGLLTDSIDNLYTKAGKPFRAIGVALFVPFSVLRLIWHQKRQIAGENDTLLAAVMDIVGAAIMVLATASLMDWAAKKVFALTGMALAQLGAGSLAQSVGLDQFLAMAANSIGMLLFSALVALGGILAALSFGLAFVAVHGMFYILTALGPIVFTVALLPPLGWLRRLWWMGFGAIVLTPFVGAAALGALGFLVSANFGGGWALGTFIVRLVWLWAAAGVMWSLLFMLTRFTFGAVGQIAGRLATGAIAAVTGLMTTGALTGITAGASGAALGAGAGMAGSALGVTEAAVTHMAKAHAFQALGNLPMVGKAFRAAAGYHRTLADVHRLRAMGGEITGGWGGGNEAKTWWWGNVGGGTWQPLRTAFETFQSLGGQEEKKAFQATLREIQEKLQDVHDPDLNGPVQPLFWAEYDDKARAPLAGALAAMYHDPNYRSLFEQLSHTENPADVWFQQIKPQAEALLNSKGTGGKKG